MRHLKMKHGYIIWSTDHEVAFFSLVWITDQVLKCGWRVITLLPQIVAEVKILTQKN